ncbi:MAG: hypothetical protein NTY48_04080 [Candidatus Diapherotrites archaeon]|nr:hypothetical protein [Candidatus Diapherotrites archaeon]
MGKSSDKCSNCGSTKSKTFWDYSDGTMLCTKCEKTMGVKWEIKHNENINNNLSLSGAQKESSLNKINPKLLIILALILLTLILLLFIFGYNNTESKKDTATRYLASVEQYFFGSHNYVADYDIITTPELGKMKVSAYKMYFLSDKNKTIIRTDITFILDSKAPSITDSIQDYYIADRNYNFNPLDDYNGTSKYPSFTCQSRLYGADCIIKYTKGMYFPNLEESSKRLLSAPIETITPTPNSYVLSFDANCFKIEERKEIICFLSDGVIAYLENNYTDYSTKIKLKTIQRDVVTDENVTVPPAINPDYVKHLLD